MQEHWLLQREYVQNIENKPKNWIVLLWYPPGLYITIYKWAKYTMSKTVTICRRDKYTMSKTVTIYKWGKYATSKTVTIYERGKYAIYETMAIWMRAWGLSMKPVVIWGIIDPSLRRIWFRRKDFKKLKWKLFELTESSGFSRPTSYVSRVDLKSTYSKKHLQNIPLGHNGILLWKYIYPL